MLHKHMYTVCICYQTFYISHTHTHTHCVSVLLHTRAHTQRLRTLTYDDVTYVYDDVTYVYDDVTYVYDDVICHMI